MEHFEKVTPTKKEGQKGQECIQKHEARTTIRKNDKHKENEASLLLQQDRTIYKVEEDKNQALIVQQNQYIEELSQNIQRSSQLFSNQLPSAIKITYTSKSANKKVQQIGYSNIGLFKDKLITDNKELTQNKSIFQLQNDQKSQKQKIHKRLKNTEHNLSKQATSLLEPKNVSQEPIQDQIAKSANIQQGLTIPIRQSITLFQENQNDSKFEASESHLQQVQGPRAYLNEIFQIEKKKNMQIVNKFLYSNAQDKIVKKCHLSMLLDSAFHNQRLKINRYAQIFQEFSRYFNQLTIDLLIKMTQKQTNQYKLIIIKIKQDLQQVKKQQATQRRRLQILAQGYLKNLTLQKVVKLDILSCFFKKNKQFKMQYSQFLGTKLMSPLYLSRLFQMQKAEIEALDRIFYDYSQWTAFDYLESFNDLIVIISLVELKYRFNNNQYLPQVAQNHKKSSKNKIQTFKSIQSSQHQTFSNNFRYKFCQLILLNEGHLFSRISSLRRVELIDKMQQLLKIEKQQDQKRQYLNLKKRFNVTLGLLYRIFIAFKQNNQEILKTFQKQIRFKENLQICKWVFLKQQGEIANILRKVTGLGFSQRQLCGNHNTFLLVNLFTIAFERFQLLAKLTTAMINVHKRVTKTQFVYIHRFQYSLNQLKRNLPSQQDSNTKQITKDPVCTVILAVTNSSIHFKCFFKKKMHDQMYFETLKTIFSAYKERQMNYNIVLYQFIFMKKMINWKLFYDFSSFFKRNLDSYVYIANSPQQFKVHFAFDYHIKDWFAKIASTVNNENFHKNIEDMVQKTLQAMTTIDFTEIFNDQ